jgi:hypothetical protein
MRCCLRRAPNKTLDDFIYIIADESVPGRKKSRGIRPGMNQRGMRFPNAKRVFVFFGGPRMASASWKACLLRALHASDALREKSILCVWVQWLAAPGETKCTEAKPPRAITKKEAAAARRRTRRFFQTQND